MSLVAGDHETCVAVPVGDLRVRPVLHQVPHDVRVAVEAGGSQRRRVGRRRLVDAGATPHQKADDVEAAGGGSAPQGRRSVDRLPIKGHRPHLLDRCTASARSPIRVIIRGRHL